MRDLIHQVRAANESALYYVALISSLALPDICAALETNDGHASGANYMAWFDKHVAPRYNGNLNGRSCYYFRCSMLHQGSTRNPRSPYIRIVFAEPGASNLILHNNILNDALNIDVRIFCEDFCQAAELWWQEAETSQIVIKNLERFVTRYPHGLAPYIVGIPIIC